MSILQPMDATGWREPATAIPLRYGTYLIALVFPQYQGRIVVAAALIAAVAASAWLARSLAAWNPRRFREIFQRGHRNLPLK